MGAAVPDLVDRRLQDALEHVVDEVGRRPRQRRVRAHAAGVRAAVAVAEPLEVLRRLERENGHPVGDAEDRDLGTVEELLDDDPPAGRRVGQRDGPVGRDDHALACREAVVLDDVGGVRKSVIIMPLSRREKQSHSLH